LDAGGGASGVRRSGRGTPVGTGPGWIGYMARRYRVVIERAADGKYGAHVPDLPGCAVCGYDTAEEARESVAVAIDMQIRGMVEDGERMRGPS
jgi:predicted RNase H-like HicB family nuclease